MTLVPAHKLSKKEQQNQRKKQNHHLVYGSGYGGGGGYATESTGGSGIVMSGRIEGREYYLGSNLAVSRHSHMAEDESTSNSFNEAAGSSEGQQDNNKEQPWLSLQLSIGRQTASPSISISTDHHSNHDRDLTLIIPPTPSASSSGLVELDLLPSGAAHSLSLSLSRPFQFQFQLPETSPRPFLGYPTSASTLTASTGASIFQQQTTVGPSFAQHQEISWAFGPLGMPSSSSWRPQVPLGSYFQRPLQFSAAGPSSDIKVVHPPRRPHTGIWFMLQASHNQAKEPFLPQIPKSYLRIKDGRMTVRLLMKYLVNKLRLESESEIEIRCRGQQLVPLLTLEHVRDNIWMRGSSSNSSSSNYPSRDAATTTTTAATTTTLLSESSTTNHIMVLHYGRSASS